MFIALSTTVNMLRLNDVIVSLRWKFLISVESGIGNFIFWETGNFYLDSE